MSAKGQLLELIAAMSEPGCAALLTQLQPRTDAAPGRCEAVPTPSAFSNYQRNDAVVSATSPDGLTKAQRRERRIAANGNLSMQSSD